MNYKNKTRILSSSLLASGILAGTANGAVVFSQSGDFITMEIINETYLMTVDQGNQSALFVVFLDVFVGGGATFNSSRVSYDMRMSVNGGSDIPLSAANTGWQYRPGNASTSPNWSPSDAAFIANAVSSNTLSTGDTVTINGTLTMDASTDPDIILPPLVSDTTETVIGGTARLYSAPRPVSTVPEPSSALLAGFSLLSCLLLRRRNP